MHGQPSIKIPNLCLRKLRGMIKLYKAGKIISSIEVWPKAPPPLPVLPTFLKSIINQYAPIPISSNVKKVAKLMREIQIISSYMLTVCNPVNQIMQPTRYTNLWITNTFII